MVDAEGFQPPVPDRVVTGWQCACEFIVVDVQVAEGYELFAKIHWQGSGQRVAPDVEVNAVAQPHALRKSTGELVRIEIEVLCFRITTKFEKEKW